MDKDRTRGQGEIISRNPKEHEERMIDCVLNNFDFKTCHKTMKYLNWTWWNTVPMIPTIDMLRSSAIERLNCAIDQAKKGRCSKSTYFSSSGGLKANAWVNKYGHLEGVRLEFVLTDWDADGDY